MQLLFSLKPIKVDVYYRVQTLYEMCHSMILVLPSEVRDKVVWNGKDEHLLCTILFYHTHIYVSMTHYEFIFKVSMYFTGLHHLVLLPHVCVLHCGVVHVLRMCMLPPAPPL